MTKIKFKNNYTKCLFLQSALLFYFLPALYELAYSGTLQNSAALGNNELLGWSVSSSGNIGIASAIQDDINYIHNAGAVYVFRNYHTTTGTVTEVARLIQSDGVSWDRHGYSVDVSGTIGLAGTKYKTVNGMGSRGAAYVYRNLDTVTGSNVTENARLLASDGQAGDEFGYSVSISGTIGLVGAPFDDTGTNTNHGSAYVFRNLHTASGSTVTEHAKLLASDAASPDLFGAAVSIDGNIGIVGAWQKAYAEGAVYVYRNLDTASNTVFQDLKLMRSSTPGAGAFGKAVSISGSIALVGAPYEVFGTQTYRGAAYVFRNVDTNTGTQTQNARLIASDGSASDYFGTSVSISGSVGLIAAPYDDFGSQQDQGSAYIFRNLDTVTGSTVTESVKIFASNGAAYDELGYSVHLDGDRFIIGVPKDEYSSSDPDRGTARYGFVRTFTTANLGSDSTHTDGISFEAREDWVVGQTTSNNSVTLTSGDSGNVGRVGLVNPTTAQTYIGQNAGSNNNTLHVQSGATLTSNSVNVGASGNSGNQLRANGNIFLSSGSVLNVFEGNILSGTGTIQGHGNNTTNNVVISGSLRPGSGAGGSGIGTLTRDHGNVTWNGNASSPWVFDLGIAQATLALANTGGTRDLLNITAGNFLKGTGSSFVFDFNGTGAGGWYKLVDWTGTTTFTASDFTAINLSPLIASYTFVIDPATSALYINLDPIPEPHIWALLAVLLGALVVIRQRLRKPAKPQTTSVS